MSKFNLEPLETCILILASGITISVSALKKIKKKTNIKNTIKQIISAASAGSVEVEGVAWPLRAITHSIDGKKIVCRSIVIKKRVKRGKDSYYEVVWSKNSIEPFLVFDQTGFFLVEPAYSQDQKIISDVVSEKKYSPYGLSAIGIGSFNEFYDNSVQGLRLTSESSFLSRFLSPDFIILEKVIEVGSPVLLHGFLIPDDSPRFISQDENLLSFREKISKVLKSKSLKLTFLDKDKDGKIDDIELKRGFSGALKVSVKTQLSMTEIKDAGDKSEKIYGSLRSSSTQDLEVINSFEDQLLNSQPILYNWGMLYLGAFLIGLSIIFFCKIIF